MAGKKIDHVGVIVNDLDGAIRFYQRVVGMELKDKFTIANGAKTLAFLGFNGSDETELELISGGNDDFPDEGKINHFAISVENIEEEFVRLKELDVTFISNEIITLPNGYRNFFFKGPEGEKIEFFQR
jgi:lactoylglutathione lyase